MSETPKHLAQVFPNPYPSVYCRIFNCHTPAKYFIGRPDAPLNTPLPVCEACAKSIVDSLPAELLPPVLVPEAPIQEPAEPQEETATPPEVPQATTQEVKEPEEDFVCECGQGFPKKANLASHQRFCRVHKGEVEQPDE